MDEQQLDDQQRFEFASKLWRHQGDAAWYFITLPLDVADDIEELTAPARRGFGSVRVEVTIGATVWRTSLFPDNKAESYVLPVKQAVRSAEAIDDGDEVRVRIALVRD